MLTDIASFNRVVGGMFMMQHRRARINADSETDRYGKFYPVVYTDSPDEYPFGPLYRECPFEDGVRTEGEFCTEPDFNKNKALLDNSGIEDITNICDTFETVPLREEFCEGTCLLTHDLTRSWDTRSQQCTQCRGMCIEHFADEDADLSRICASCLNFEAAREDDENSGMYSSLGSLHFLIPLVGARTFMTAQDGDSEICASYKTRCAQLLCDSCIDTGPSPVQLNSPVSFNANSAQCLSRLPICDDYLYTERRLTCATSVLPEIGGCDPTTIGEGTCNEGCNTVACEYDRGDCCAENLASRHMPACSAEWNATVGWTGAIADRSCHPECWNEYCLQDGGDCVFCSESCMLPTGSGQCSVCRDDCRSPECEAICPGHSACLGECDACPMDRNCISDEITHGISAERTEAVANLPQCFPQKVGDGNCDFECFTDSCSFDAGDCGTCPPECVLRQGDGICDQDCYDYCPREIEDCPDCSDGCTPFEVGDGTCNSECFNVACQFDAGDCYYCGSDCVGKMGDGHCDAECYIGACELDGGDCNVCNPSTGCLNSLVDNSVCDKQCFNFECNFDGQDCYHCDRRPECSDRFVGDGVCDYDCYHEVSPNAGFWLSKAGRKQSEN